MLFVKLTPSDSMGASSLQVGNKSGCTKNLCVKASFTNESDCLLEEVCIALH